MPPLVRHGGQWPETVIPPFVVGLFPSPTVQMAASGWGNLMTSEILQISCRNTVPGLNLLFLSQGAKMCFGLLSPIFFSLICVCFSLSCLQHSSLPSHLHISDISRWLRHLPSMWETLVQSPPGTNFSQLKIYRWLMNLINYLFYSHLQEHIFNNRRCFHLHLLVPVEALWQGTWNISVLGSSWACLELSGLGSLDG